MSVNIDFDKTSLDEQIKALEEIFEAQFSGFLSNPYLSYAERVDKLTKLFQALKTYTPELNQAMSLDFNTRCYEESVLIDILPCLEMLKYTIKRLKSWMKPSKRKAGLLYFPAQVEVHYQALGVVGIIVPWNAPLTLSLIPLASALAAGNRVMLKMSELSPHTNQCLKKMLTTLFDPSEVCLIEGNSQIASAFSRLPFDHLLFTGSSQVGKKVMRAAAENLTPLTLELGGKSPVLIAQDACPKRAAKNVFFGKALNAGQLCVAPDHLFVFEENAADFIDALKHEWQSYYPQGIKSPELTSIISMRHFERLKTLIEQAEQEQIRVIPLAEPSFNTSDKKMALHLVINPPANSTLMQQEIFGPILPIFTYQDQYQVIAQFKNQPRPLALYLMTSDKAFKGYVIRHTHSGSLAINDTITQVGLNDAPFGGIGASGFGAYHGFEGFQRFSHAKTVLARKRFNLMRWLSPPYTSWLKKRLLNHLLK
jgi:coniferyl-aldehyde dehydrogenase